MHTGNPPMSDRKRILENIASLGTLQAANYIFPLIVMPYLIRVLGAERFGLVAFAQAVSQYVVVLTDYGFAMTAARDIAIHRTDPARVSSIVSTVLFIKCLLMAGGLLALGLIVLVVPSLRSEWQLYGLWSIMVVGSVLFPAYYFQGTEQMRHITVLNVTARALALLAVFVFVRSSDDYLLAAGIQAGAFLVAGATGIAFVVLRRGVRLVAPTKADVSATLKEGSQVFTATLAGNVYGQGAVLVAGMIAGNAAAGYYTLARNVTNALSSLMQPVAQAIYPHLSRMFVSSDAGYCRFRRRILLGGAAVALCLAIGQFVGSGMLTGLLAGRQIAALRLLFQVMSITLFFTALNVLIGPMLLSMKSYRSMQQMYIAAAVLFLAVVFPAAVNFGAPGVAAAISLVELFVFVRGVRIARLLT